MGLTVVIPAYNAARHLPSCLASLMRQPVSKLEIICVDDGSTDDTATVLASLAQEDDRIRVISQPNAGVSAARNRGLEHATGDIVLFMDADDQLTDGALKVIESVFAAYDCDCAVFGLEIDPPEAAPLTLSHRLIPRDAVYEGFDPALIFKEHTHPYAFRVAFSREFLERNHLRFDTRLSLGEDEAFLLSAYRLSRRTVLSPHVVYRYVMDTQSASHKDNESVEVLPAKVDKHLALVDSILGDWQERGLDGSCDEQIVMWALDLLLLDSSRLDDAFQRLCLVRLWQVLESRFGDAMPRLHGPARLCLADVRRAQDVPEGDRVLPKSHLVSFYVQSRGVAAVVERARAALHGRGAY